MLLKAVQLCSGRQRQYDDGGQSLLAPAQHITEHQEKKTDGRTDGGGRSEAKQSKQIGQRD